MKIQIEEKFIQFDDRNLYAKLISSQNGNSKIAVYLHGGGIYGNSSLVERPAKFLLEQNAFGKIILFDRLGFGKSSPLTKTITNREQAEIIKIAIKKLIDENSYTLICSSYGGLTGLWLAHFDNSANKIYLMASSPSLNSPNFLYRFLGKAKLLKLFFKLTVFLFLGRSKNNNFSQDEFYNAKKYIDFTKTGIKSIKNIKRKSINSVFLNIDSMFKKENLSFPIELKIRKEVIQIVGSEDEFWKKPIGKSYLKNYESFKRIEIKGANHKDLILRMKEFHEIIINNELNT